MKPTRAVRLKGVTICNPRTCFFNPHVMKVHHVKTHPLPFSSIIDGDKNFEYRKNDRDYTEGDMIVLTEYCPFDKKYTGRRIQARIGHVVNGPDFGIPVGFCAFSLLKILI